MPKSIKWKYSIRKHGGSEMNFYDKKFRKIVSGVILVIIVAMLATSVLPYIM